jgi:hypothetical protein
MPEQRQAFQRELDAIDAMVIELFDLVAADLARATPAFLDGNSEAVKVLAEHGMVIGLAARKSKNGSKRQSCWRRPSLRTCASCSAC